MLWIQFFCVDLNINQKQKDMTYIFISINGDKAGEQIFFKVEFEKSNCFNIIDLISEFKTIEDVLTAESKGLFRVI